MRKRRVEKGFLVECYIELFYYLYTRIGIYEKTIRLVFYRRPYSMATKLVQMAVRFSLMYLFCVDVSVISFLLRTNSAKFLIPTID